MRQTLTRCGIEPRFTPVDHLMASPLGVHLSVADELDTDEDDYAPNDVPEGFQEVLFAH